jgi:hypothetical protein
MTPTTVDEIAGILAIDDRFSTYNRAKQLAANIARAPLVNQSVVLAVLFSELVRLGVDVFDLVPCVLDELASGEG